MRDGSYDVCQNCYRKHMNKHTCSGCGESKPVKANCNQNLGCEKEARCGMAIAVSAHNVTESI